jgi:formiminoglutamate deiminase
MTPTTPETTYFAEHAHLPTGAASGVRLTVTDGRFSAVETRTRPRPGDIRLGGVVLPGMANAHSHVFHRALRGRTHGAGGAFWTWRQQMYAVTRRLDPDTYLALARAVFAEMALAGFTVVGEFHYLHHDVGGRHYDDPNAMGRALVQAAADVGIRLTLLDTCYLSGGLQADGHLPLDEVQRRFSDGSVDVWAERVAELKDGDGLRVGAAIHSVRAVPREHLAAMVDAASGLPLHAHVSEQPAENMACQLFYGATPTQLLHEAGALGPEFTAVHATHLTDEDVALLGGSGTTACFCPTTERDLADGIGPARALHDAGSPLSIGSDQNAVIDPFEELRGLEMHERLSSGERGRFTTAELVAAASRNGYRSLGWEGGELHKGAPADFIAVTEDSVRTVGSRSEQVIYSATGADVTDVVVGGAAVVVAGRHLLGSTAHLLREALGLLRDP